MIGKKDQTDKVDTLIGAGTVIEGELTSSASVRIDGQIHGGIKGEGAVTIGKEGRIDGDVQAKNVTLEGTINGHVQVSNHLFLASTSQLHGDIYATSFEIEKGAVFNGQSHMQQEKNNPSKPTKKQKDTSSEEKE